MKLSYLLSKDGIPAIVCGEKEEVLARHDIPEDFHTVENMEGISEWYEEERFWSDFRHFALANRSRWERVVHATATGECIMEVETMDKTGWIYVPPEGGDDSLLISQSENPEPTMTDAPAVTGDLGGASGSGNIDVGDDAGDPYHQMGMNKRYLRDSDDSGHIASAEDSSVIASPSAERANKVARKAAKRGGVKAGQRGRSSRQRASMGRGTCA